jgi:hypothetical protein
MLGAAVMAHAKGEAHSRCQTPTSIQVGSSRVASPQTFARLHTGSSPGSSRRSSHASLAEALDEFAPPKPRSRPLTPASIDRLSQPRPRTTPSRTATGVLDGPETASTIPSSGKGSLAFSASMESLRLKRSKLLNSSSLQSLAVRKSVPSFGFGASSREVANKLFVSQAHTLSIMSGRESPGPTKYSLPASVGGKQPDGRKPDPPVWSMGKPGSRFLYGYGVVEDHCMRTGPARYPQKPAIGGKQPDAARKSPPVWTMGTSTRDQNQKVWISKEITQSLLAGTQSPGPARYGPVCSVGGKQPDGAHCDAPSWSLRDRSRPPIEAGLDTPGAGEYKPKRGIGRESDKRESADPMRSEPAYTFATTTRPPVDAGLDSPGMIYNLPSACGKPFVDHGGKYGARPSGGKPSAPNPRFSQHSRWHYIERERRENTVPGPGHYG